MTQLFIALFLPLLSPSFQLYSAVVCKESNCSSSIKIQCFLFSLNNKYVVDVFSAFHCTFYQCLIGNGNWKVFFKDRIITQVPKVTPTQWSQKKTPTKWNASNISTDQDTIFFYQYRHGLQNRLTLSKACQWHTISTTMYSCDRR